MKRFMALCLVLILAASAVPAALAEQTDRYAIGDWVAADNCKEYINLRETPDADAAVLKTIPLGDVMTFLYMASEKFACVVYNGRTGYVNADYISLYDGFRWQPVEVSDEERYNINLFLSNFSEQSFMRGLCYNEEDFRGENIWQGDAYLLDFAIQHIWFNRQDYLEFGDYFGENNVRLNKKYLPDVISRYFGYEIEDMDCADYDQAGDYYYWQETGGHLSDGFVSLYDVEALGDARYAVRFNIYGMGEEWTNDACYFTNEMAERSYSRMGAGMAVIVIGGPDDTLTDRSSWRIQCWTMM